jgi:hypothetical protein
MRRDLRLTAAISLAASLALVLPAMAQQPYERDHRQGPPGHAAPAGHPPGTPGGYPQGAVPGAHPGANFRQGPGGPHPGGAYSVHALGERGYSFRGAGGVRREIVAFSPRERQIWVGGRWHHERRFGRLGYWYEVNGSWYFYDRPFDGPPAFVSEVEFVDPDLADEPAEAVVAPAPVIVAPAPVVVVPPAVCIGPLCVR